MPANLKEIEPLTTRKIRGAVYARYSSEMQSATSAEDQINRIFHMTKKNQILSRRHPNCQVDILEEWIHKDEATTGRVAGRRGYQNILDGIRRQCFDMLIVDDLSRLTRSLGNLLELYQLLRHYDIELISIVDQVSSDDHNAKTFFTVKGMIADFGNEAHAERTKRGLEARALAEFSTGQRPYGYDSIPTQSQKRKGRIVHSHYKIVVNEEHAGIVRQIYNLYTQGYGKCYIAKWLNDRKIKAPKGCASGWQIGPISRILQNEKYIGQWVFNKNAYSYDPDTGKKVKKARSRADWIITVREDLRIINQDLWDAVKKRFAENLEERNHPLATAETKIFGKRNRIDNRGLLTGFIMCAKCGGGCILVSGRRGGYYGCADAHRHGTCTHKYLLRKDRAEKAVIECLRVNLASSKLIEFATKEYNSRIREYLQRFPNRRKEIQSELNRLCKEIENLVNFISSGVASDLDTVAKALREKESRKYDLEREFKSLGAENNKAPLMTPFAIKEKINRILDLVASQSDKFNGALASLFSESLILNRETDRYVLKGQMNVGAALAFEGSRDFKMAVGSDVHLANPESRDGNQGSGQCTIASPRGFEPRSPP